MKKILSVALALLCIFSSSAFAKDYPIPHDVRKVPNSVYFTPYKESVFATRYSLWMRNFHFIKQSEIDRGETGGEGCQYIKVIAISPVDPNVMFMGSDCAALYKTENGGDYWFNTNNNNAGHDCWGILCDKFDVNIVYACMRKSGIQRSRDGGRTWEVLVEDPDPQSGRRDMNRFSQDDAGNTYFATPTGIYRLDRETDELTNLYPAWENIVASAKEGARVRDVDVSGDGQDIYVCVTSRGSVAGGMYTSHDGGKTWTIKGPTETRTTEFITTEIDPRDDNTIYSAFSYKELETGESLTYCMYVSHDKGNTYELLHKHYKNDEVNGTYNIRFGPLNKDGVYPMYFRAAQSINPLQVSYDYGQTWTPIFTGDDGINADTARNPHPTGSQGWTYAGYDVCPQTGKVVFWMTAPWEWKEGKFRRINGGYSGVSVMDIAFDSKGKMLFATTDSGSFKTEAGYYSENSYPTTIHSIDDHFTHVTFDPNDDNHIIYYTGSANGESSHYGVRQSYDGAMSVDPWNEDGSLPKAEAIYGNTKMLLYDMYDQNIIYSTYFNSYDNGKTWVKNDPALLAVSEQDTHKQVGIKGKGANIELYYTNDGGKTWEFLLKPGKITINDTTFDSADNNFMWYAGEYTLGCLDIKRKKVESHTGKLAYGSLRMIKSNPRVPGHILVSTTGGSAAYGMENDPKVYETRDSGKTWHPVPGLWGSANNSITFSPITDEAFIGTMGGLQIYEYKKYWEFLDSKISVKVNDAVIDPYTMPVSQDGVMMVPLRELCEKLGGNVSYNAQSGEITASLRASFAKFTPGNTKCIINEEEYTMQKAPYINEKGVTMVPLSFLGKALDVNVGESTDSKAIYIFAS